jgi:phosphoribosylamine--glycine ligase
MRLKSDLVEVMLATVDQKLDQVTLEWDRRTAVCVVLASEGYGWKPDDQVTRGVEITGLEEAGKTPDTVIFHAGTAPKEGRLVTSGGRVLGVTSLGDTLAQARDRAHAAIEKIHFAGMQFRRDIGAKAR